MIKSKVPCVTFMSPSIYVQIITIVFLWVQTTVTIVVGQYTVVGNIKTKID